MAENATEPDPALASFLNSLLDKGYRERVGALGLLRLMDPTRTAMRAYEQSLVWQARLDGATWEQVGDALGIPKQTAHRRFAHVDGGEGRVEELP